MNEELKNREGELVDYVVSQIKLGVSHDEIKKQLHAVGWSDDETDGAYARGLMQAGVPVPSENTQKVFSKKSTTVEIVINFFSFILLGILSISWGVLLYGIINHNFPDKLKNYYAGTNLSSQSIHYAIAALIISFPLYYLAMRFWFRRFREDEGKVESRLTRWITYLVLLVAAITIVGDLITLIFSMLQGEITTRFFLKSLTILMIAGLVFGFYFFERKKVQYRKDIDGRKFVIFGWIVTGAIFISIILGFFSSGSPKTERMRSFDVQRASDLQTLADCVGSYAIKNGALPESLDALMEDSAYSYCSDRNDPENDFEYEYKVLNKSYQNEEVKKGDFELCANFSLASTGTGNNDNSYGYYDSKWSKHAKGRSCDKETIVIKSEL